MNAEDDEVSSACKREWKHMEGEFFDSTEKLWS